VRQFQQLMQVALLAGAIAGTLLFFYQHVVVVPRIVAAEAYEERQEGARAEVMIDPATPASVKVRAAEAIFNHAAKAIEIEDIEARVTELERAAGSSRPGM
jgi:predicted cobalt transporter CbtA